MDVWGWIAVALLALGAVIATLGTKYRRAHMSVNSFIGAEDVKAPKRAKTVTQNCSGRIEFWSCSPQLMHVSSETNCWIGPSRAFIGGENTGLTNNEWRHAICVVEAFNGEQ